MRSFDSNIATFVEVVRRQSLAATGRHLGVPKSTVSRRLTRLEEQLDTVLVHRDSRRVLPTTEGQRFYESVVDAVDTLNRAVAGIEQSTTEPRGTIRVTAPSDLGRLILIERFAEFLDRYPKISLDLIFANRVVDLVKEGVDVALRGSAVADPNWIARPFMSGHLRLAAAPDFPVPDDIHELDGHNFVLHHSPSGSDVVRLHRYVSAPGEDRQREEPVESVQLKVSGRVNVDDYAAMVEFVSRGQGIGLMPEIHLNDAVSNGRAIPLFPQWGHTRSSLQVVYSTGQLPERVRLFVDFLCQ